MTKASRRAISQAISRWLLTVEGWVKSQVIHLGFVIHNLTLQQVILRIPRVSSVNYRYTTFHIHSPFIWGKKNRPNRGRFFLFMQRSRTRRIQNNERTKDVSQPKHAINTKTLLNSTGDADQWLDSHHGCFTPGPLVPNY
jgi:hypothetical protein